MTFGERLRELREEKGITQKTLAEVLCVSPRMVSFYESGTHFISDETQLLQLADYFGVTTDYLLGHTPSDFEHEQQRLNSAFAALSAEARRSALDYLEFLADRNRKTDRAD